MKFQAKIIVTLRSSILDPQGSAVAKSLKAMSYPVESVRVGKYMEVLVEAAHEAEAEEKVREMCVKLLVNTVTEDYQLQLERMEG